MEYTNSSLVSFTQLSPNHSGKRTHGIDRITPHCYVGQVTVERMGKGWAEPGNTSANYGIGSDGRVGLYVEEKNRAWTSSSKDNDQRAITIECACDKEHPYGFKGNVYDKLIDLCTDICKRNGKAKLIWFNDKNKSLNYEPASDEMIITVHRWFVAKECPGDWLYSRLGSVAAEVTKRLGGSYEEDKKETQNDGIKYHVQVGAFSNKQNAEELVEKLKAAGFNAIIEIKEGILDKVIGESFKVGDTVKLQKGAPRYGKTTGFSLWVYDATLYVREIVESRVVVSTQKSGAITGAVDKKYLTKI